LHGGGSGRDRFDSIAREPDRLAGAIISHILVARSIGRVHRPFAFDPLEPDHRRRFTDGWMPIQGLRATIVPARRTGAMVAFSPRLLKCTGQGSICRHMLVVMAGAASGTPAMHGNPKSFRRARSRAPGWQCSN